MFGIVVLIGIFFQTTKFTLVDTAKQQVQLSESYLPVAMQIIAHLTDQMAYEVKDDQPTGKPTSRPTARPTTRPTYVPFTTKPWSRPTAKPTVKPTGRPTSYGTNKPTNGWWMSYSTQRVEQTTLHHKPGLYAPVSPPKPGDRLLPKQEAFVLLPIDNNAQYTVIEPQEKRTEEPLLSIQDEEVKPIIEPTPESAHLLPPHFDNLDKSSRSDDELDNLQYLSQGVRDLIKMARNPEDDRLLDVWDGVKGGQEVGSSKAKLSSSNLRLLLLYDLLTREAKRQQLNNFYGFSPEVMKNLVESANGGARAQLSFALAKMVERRDCEHEYANNRAKEMVAELSKDESKLSSELRYLQPLVYKF